MQARGEREAEVDALIAGWTSQHTKEEAMRVIGAAGVPAGAVFDTMELQNDPSLAARGIMQTIEHPTTGTLKMPAWPVRFDGKPPRVKPSPLLGQHTKEVLGGWIGIGAAVMQIPARTPTMTAMTAATLDVLSGGRFRLGLGVAGPFDAAGHQVAVIGCEGVLDPGEGREEVDRAQVLEQEVGAQHQPDIADHVDHERLDAGSGGGTAPVPEGAQHVGRRADERPLARFRERSRHSSFVKPIIRGDSYLRKRHNVVPHCGGRRID